MNFHPENTEQLFEMAGLSRDACILDMGAGDGNSGCSVMIDIAPRSESVIQADMLALPFEDGMFDGVLSQCAFYASGDPHRAMDEAMRVLKPGGKLMLSDVFFEEPWFDYDACVDLTAQWREYYLRSLWSDEPCPPLPKGETPPKYYLIVRSK